MPNKSGPDFGRIISDALQDALLSGDFSRLRKTVNTTLNTVVDKTIDCAKNTEEAASRLFGGGRPFSGTKPPPGWGPCAWDPGRVQEPVSAPPSTEKPHSSQQPDFNRQAPPGQGSAAARTASGPAPQQPHETISKAGGERAIIPAPAYLKKKIWDTVLGIFMAVVGILMAVPAGIAALTMAVHEFPYGFRVFPAVIISILATIALLCAFLASSGIRKRGRAKRFGRYWALISKKGFCEIQELARAVEKKPRFVVEDLTRMLNAGLIPQGRLDDGKTCLIVGEELYRQYRSTQESLKERARNPRSENAVIVAGLEAVQQIRAANAALPGAVITEKLSRLEDVTANIFAYVEQRPAKLQEIRRFMDYYLPTTVKLVKAYQDFEAQPETASVITAKDEILGTLDTISTAFETLLDGLYQDDAMDISTDISVLKTMLAQEGLTENDFEKRMKGHE